MKESSDSSSAQATRLDAQRLWCSAAIARLGAIVGCCTLLGSLCTLPINGEAQLQAIEEEPTSPLERIEFGPEHVFLTGAAAFVETAEILDALLPKRRCFILQFVKHS
jgi:hypothetical protein